MKKTILTFTLSMLIMAANAQLLVNDSCQTVLKFEGANNAYVQVAHDSMLNLTTDWTMELWLKPTNNGSNYQALISKNSTPNRPISMWYYQQKIELWMTPGNNVLTSKDSIFPGEWVHIAATYDSSMLSLYLNGVLDTSIAFTSVPDINTQPLFFGQRGDNQYYLYGSLDDIRIWGTVRTATQIANNMHNELTGNETGLIGYWNMNDGAPSDTAHDLTSNGFHGKLVNMDSTMVWVNAYDSLPDSAACAPVYGCTNPAYVEYNPNATIDDGSCQTLVNPGGILADKLSKSIHIYPNPSHDGMINIALEKDAKFEHISIVNIAGELVATIAVNGQTNITYAASELVAGMYFVKATSSTQNLVKVLIIN